MLGQTLGHYVIEAQLGAGGMGVVYKAHDTQLDRDVALKVIPPEILNPTLEEAFRREARLASALNHPAIVTIYDVIHEKGLAGIVMEYLAGQTLNNLIPEQGFAVEKAVELAIQIAEGVAAAHAAGIVHRDLKPGNVLITANGRVKILDFGLAKLVEKPTDAATRTLSIFGDKVVGTIAYMAPEQARAETVDHRADIFSFGVILNQMLTGRLPFHAPNPVALIRAIQDSAPNPPRQLRPEIPERLAATILQALAKKPDDRFHNMIDVIHALREYTRPLPPSRTTIARSAPTPAQATVVESQGVAGAVPPVIGSERTSIAVLRFRAIGAGEDDNFLAEGLASEVIHALTGVPGLRVAPQRASFKLGSDAADPVGIGRTLNTRYVVTGEIRHSGQRIRVSVELVDTIEERIVWTQKYDRMMADVFDMQEEISKAIVRSLGGQLIRVVTDFAYRTPTENLDAWGLVRKAYHIYNYEFSPAGIQQAMLMLRRALELDPNYGAAYAYLSMCLLQSVLHGMSKTPEADWAEALGAADTAVKLAPNESEVLAWCSGIWLQNGMYEKAVQVLQRAVKIAPFDLVAWGYLGLGHVSAGGEKEVLLGQEILMQLLADAPDHPSVPYWSQFLAVAQLRLGNYGGAAESARRAVELQPGYTLHVVLYAEALCRLGKKEESLKALASIQEYAPGYTLEHFEKIVMGFCRSAETVEKVCGCLKTLHAAHA
ncbi:MAG TPA: protein kinase [Candidatus Limnocylindrales bacterium]|nr:protein kinase [Candidatus Limnocylindrales bacterium]